MESALVTLILVTVVLFGTLTLSDTYFTTQDMMMEATQVMNARNQEQARTVLSTVTAETKSAGTNIELVLENSGSTKLADFDQWDLVVQYYSAPGNYFIKRLPYTSAASPGDNQWTVVGIYQDASTVTPEVYDPGIFNPGEQILIRAKVFPPVGPKTTNLATIAVANGVSQSIIFVRG